jgi:O-antigen/teichoic acid export membrane protein
MSADLTSRGTTEAVAFVFLVRLKIQLQKFLPLCALVASRGSAIAAQFATQLLVGALAGANGLGILQLIASWTCIAGEVLALGLPSRAMRQISVAYANQQGELIERVIRDSRRKIIWMWLSIVMVVAVPLAALMSVGMVNDWTHYTGIFVATAITAPVFALLRLYSESLKSTGAALPAITIENLTSPLTLMLVCTACWLAGQPVVALTLVIAFTASVGVAHIALQAALRQQLKQMPRLMEPYGHASATPVTPQGDLLYLWGSSVLSIAFLHLPFLIMPLYLDTAEIGVFAIAYKLINVITTLLLLLVAVFGPDFARYAARQDRAGLLGLLRRTQLISSAVFLPTALIVISLSQPLSKLFGEEFADLRIYLIVLAAGHLVNAATGLSGVLLNMAGAASRELATLMLALAVAVVGSVFIGPHYGATGLALVFSFSVAVKNLASYILARHLLNSTGELT